jgi:hypothetical protein
LASLRKRSRQYGSGLTFRRRDLAGRLSFADYTNGNVLVSRSMRVQVAGIPPMPVGFWRASQSTSRCGVKVGVKGLRGLRRFARHNDLMQRFTRGRGVWGKGDIVADRSIESIAPVVGRCFWG